MSGHAKKSLPALRPVRVVVAKGTLLLAAFLTASAPPAPASVADPHTSTSATVATPAPPAPTPAPSSRLLAALAKAAYRASAASSAPAPAGSAPAAPPTASATATAVAPTPTATPTLAPATPAATLAPPVAAEAPAQSAAATPPTDTPAEGALSAADDSSSTPSLPSLSLPSPGGLRRLFGFDDSGSGSTSQSATADAATPSPTPTPFVAPAAYVQARNLLLGAGGEAVNWIRGRAELEAAVATGDPFSRACKGLMLFRGDRAYPRNRPAALALVKEALPAVREAAASGSSDAQVLLGEILLHGATANPPAFAPAEGLALIQRAADAGNPIAMAALADALATGHHIPRNGRIALEWARKAAAAGNSQGIALEARFLLYDIGAGQSNEDAARLYRKAAEQGDPPSRVELGMLMLRGIGTRKDSAQARQQFLAATEQGYGPGFLALADSYRQGRGVRKSMEQCVRWLRAGTELGDPACMTRLAALEADGKVTGTPRIEESNRLLRQAADLGSAAALYWLGQHHEKGVGFPASAEQAAKLYLAAEATGDPFGYFAGAVAHSQGLGVARSAAEAHARYLRGAELGDTTCMVAAGLALFEGRNVPRSDAAALKWFRRGAEHGDPASMTFIAMMLTSPRTTVNIENSEALAALREAIEQDFVMAYTYMGLMYEQGRGVMQSKVEAAKWYRIAAARNDPFAADLLKQATGKN